MAKFAVMASAWTVMLERVAAILMPAFSSGKRSARVMSRSQTSRSYPDIMSVVLSHHLSGLQNHRNVPCRGEYNLALNLMTFQPWKVLDAKEVSPTELDPSSIVGPGAKKRVGDL